MAISYTKTASFAIALFIFFVVNQGPFPAVMGSNHPLTSVMNVLMFPSLYMPSVTTDQTLYNRGTTKKLRGKKKRQNRGKWKKTQGRRGGNKYPEAKIQTGKKTQNRGTETKKKRGRRETEPRETFGHSTSNKSSCFYHHLSSS
ncbi:hypothetical protein NC652_000314 [Populus alba x Populus x berolinensis]|nr:hypothetical protein NC652_000314 [Populus alba x Populus x berolinensis]